MFKTRVWRLFLCFRPDFLEMISSITFVEKRHKKLQMSLKKTKTKTLCICLLVGHVLPSHQSHQVSEKSHVPLTTLKMAFTNRFMQNVPTLNSVLTKTHLGERKSPAQKEDHSPAHLRLDQPPSDQRRRVLQTLLHRRERPEVVRLGRRLEVRGKVQRISDQADHTSSLNVLLDSMVPVEE